MVFEYAVCFKRCIPGTTFYKKKKTAGHNYAAAMQTVIDESCLTNRRSRTLEM